MPQKYFKALLIASLVALTNCGFGEYEYVERSIRSIPGITRLKVYGGSSLWGADGGLLVDATLQNETFLSFQDVSYSSVGPAAKELIVDQVDGLFPRAVACLSGPPSTGPERWNPRRRFIKPDFHIHGLFGAHVSPGIVDLVDAVKRYREIRAAVLRWPRCPSYWEFVDAAGTKYRYCAEGRKGIVSSSPPWPAECE